MSYQGVAPPRDQTIPADRFRRGEATGTRPWSGLEAQERAEEILTLLAEAVDAELSTGIAAAKAEADYRLAKAKALAEVGGRNSEEREANVTLLLIERAGDDLDPRQARDHAAVLHRYQRERVAWLQTEARIAQSLVVDARNADR